MLGDGDVLPNLSDLRAIRRFYFALPTVFRLVLHAIVGIDRAQSLFLVNKQATYTFFMFVIIIMMLSVISVFYIMLDCNNTITIIRQWDITFANGMGPHYPIRDWDIFANGTEHIY